MPKCLSCLKINATKDALLGYLGCAVCLRRQREYRVSETIEVTTSDIKESRKEYADDIIQRWRGDTPNKKYIKKYGSKGFTDEEVKRARDVYPGYYKDE